MTTVIRDTIIATCDPDGRILYDGAIAIDDNGIIAAVGPAMRSFAPTRLPTWSPPWQGRLPGILQLPHASDRHPQPRHPRRSWFSLPVAVS